MNYLTHDKLVIVGAAGMIGSNMAQTAIMMGLTPNICLYDPYGPALEGVAEELRHCGFEGAEITFTTDVREAFTGAKYIVNSGGAARKAGMTREDLLKGNAGIAEEFGKNVRQYCPDVKHIVVVFNPGSRYLIRIRHLRGFHSWVPFSFLAPVCAMVCASVKFNVTWFNKFYLYKDTILLSNFN